MYSTHFTWHFGEGGGGGVGGGELESLLHLYNYCIYDFNIFKSCYNYKLHFFPGKLTDLNLDVIICFKGWEGWGGGQGNSGGINQYEL